MSITHPREFDGMQRISFIVADTLKKMKEFTRPGLSTKHLDDYGRKLLNSYGARSAPEKDYQFPGATCISVNHVAAHGIPNENIIIQDGDLVNIDVSAERDGFYGDNGESFIVGEDARQLQPLVNASREIIRKAMARIRHGERVSGIGKLIEDEAHQRGFTTIKNLMGHGIGYRLHDGSYDLPNFNMKRNKQRFKRHTVVALETFISTRACYVSELSDGWSLVADDGSYIVQHEHTLIVTDNEPIILTRHNGI